MCLPSLFIGVSVHNFLMHHDHSASSSVLLVIIESCCIRELLPFYQSAADPAWSLLDGLLFV